MGCGESKEAPSSSPAASRETPAAPTAAAAPGNGETPPAPPNQAQQAPAAGGGSEAPAYSSSQAESAATPGGGGMADGAAAAGGEEAPAQHRQVSHTGSMKGSMVRLRVISINDVYELENLPRFATAVQDYRSRDKEDQCHSVVLLPGDFVAPSLLSSLDHAEGMIECLNHCGVEYVCFGNHETDIPHEELKKRIQQSNFKWVNTNMQDINLGSDIGKLPTHEVITVKGALGQERRVGILGLLTEDHTLYLPGAFHGATIQPVLGAAEESLKLYGEEQLDLVIPMTHQSLQRDKDFAEAFQGKFPGGENDNAFPLVIGGHDHEPYQVEVGGAEVIKVGSEATYVGISRVVWPDAEGKRVTVTTELKPVSEWAPDPKVEAIVHRRMETVRELDNAPLFVWDKPEILSSKDNRIQETTLSTKLVSMLRDALGSDCCVLNAGNIRGNKEYDKQHKFFTYNDLKSEIPFDAEMIVVPMPGHVVSQAVAHSRQKAFQDPPVSTGGYLHIDDGMEFDPATKQLVKCGGKPFDPEKTYQVGTLFMAMTGVDDNHPLINFTDSNHHLFPVDKSAEMGRPAKLLLVDYMSKAIWYQLGCFDDMDEGDKGYLTAEDIHKAIDKHFSTSVGKIVVHNMLAAADNNADGKISREEMLRVTMVNATARREMDEDGSGTLDREEVRNFVRRVISEKEEEVQKLVDLVFEEHHVEGDDAHIEQSHVLAFVQSSFSIHGVKMPGHKMDRSEITAAKSRLQKQMSDKEAAGSTGGEVGGTEAKDSGKEGDEGKKEAA